MPTSVASRPVCASCPRRIKRCSQRLGDQGEFDQLALVQRWDGRDDRGPLQQAASRVRGSPAGPAHGHHQDGGRSVPNARRYLTGSSVPSASTTEGESPWVRQPAHTSTNQESELRWLGETSTYFLATGSRREEHSASSTSTPVAGKASRYIGTATTWSRSTYWRARSRSFSVNSRGCVRRPVLRAHTRRNHPRLPSRVERGALPHPHDAATWAFYRAITLASRPGGLPPLDSVQGSQIKQASRDYGVEFVGPLPDRID